MPAARVSAPTAAAGSTRPPWVGHVGERDDLDPLVEHRLERPDIHAAGRVVRDPLDRRARAVGHLAQRDVVARVLGLRRQDPVAGAEAHRVERHVPRAGGVLDDADLVGVAADQRRDGVVGVLDPVGAPGGRLVPADRHLELEVLDDRLVDGRRRERRAGVVEVRDVRDARRLGSGALDVDHATGAV